MNKASWHIPKLAILSMMMHTGTGTFSATESDSGFLSPTPS